MNQVKISKLRTNKFEAASVEEKVDMIADKVDEILDMLKDSSLDD